MDYYEILEVSPSADVKSLKKAYLKIAKKYHPDIYKGINTEYFKRANEAFNTLKSPVKRDEYDRKIKIHKMKHDKNFKDFDRKSAKAGFDRKAYERMKKRKSTLRTEIDPEFEEELKKHDFDKMFRQFNQRPMRTDPEDLRVMEPEILKKMSRRDIARLKFVQKHREQAKINSSIKLKFMEQRLKLLDVQETGGMDQKSYKQLVEEINKTYKAIEAQEKPLQVYKDEEQTIQAAQEEQDKNLKKAKRIIWPIFGIAFLVNGLIMIGVYYQQKESLRNEPKFEAKRKLYEMHLERDNPSTQVPLNLVTKPKNS